MSGYGIKEFFKKGYIYWDKSKKDDKRRFNCWCAEIFINGKRYRRRSVSYEKCEDFLHWGWREKAFKDD